MSIFLNYSGNSSSTVIINYCFYRLSFLSHNGRSLLASSIYLQQRSSITFTVLLQHHNLFSTSQRRNFYVMVVNFLYVAMTTFLRHHSGDLFGMLRRHHNMWLFMAQLWHYHMVTWRRHRCILFMTSLWHCNRDFLRCHRSDIFTTSPWWCNIFT